MCKQSFYDIINNKILALSTREQNMSKYDVILFDADETLFNFCKAEKQALIKTLEYYNIPYSEELNEKYSAINESLWKRYEQDEIDNEYLQKTRFTQFFKELLISYDGIEANEIYLNYLSDGTYLLPHAKEVCETLHKTHVLYIVTNGISRVQRKRFEMSEIKPYFKGVFVSEDTKFQKPQKEYFDYVFKKIEIVDKQNILLVGDSLTSDILGANNAKIDCCWYNPHKHENKTDAIFTYEIHSLIELYQIV